MYVELTIRFPYCEDTAPISNVTIGLCLAVATDEELMGKGMRVSLGYGADIALPVVKSLQGSFCSNSSYQIPVQCLLEG
jgi:hypothetical protein